MWPLPPEFALAAWSRVMAEIEVAPEVKPALQAEAMRLYSRNALPSEFVRGMGAVLHGKPWAWLRGSAILQERLGEQPCDEDLLEALYQWLISAAQQLFRRGQIRAQLAEGRGHLIKVLVDDEYPAPCGATDQQVLEPTADVLKRLPPCSHPLCSCRWLLIPGQS